MRHIRNIVFDKKTVADWRYNLPQVQRIMNASINQSIGCTPADILYGGAITLDRGILTDPRTGTPGDVSLSAWSANRLKMQGLIIAKAQEVQRRAQSIHESNIPTKLTEFPGSGQLRPSRLSRQRPAPRTTKQVSSISKGAYASGIESRDKVYTT